MSSRKRRAPGASPNLQSNAFNQNTSGLASDSYLNNWNDASVTGDMNSFDPTLYDTDLFSGNIGGAKSEQGNRITALDTLDDGSGPDQDPASFSGQLVRRNPNQQLAARGRSAWDTFTSDMGNGQQTWENTDDDEELEQKALLAKKDAQSKRKQIPPFVQKLSSFLDEKNNTNLIRWSDDGNSFIVLDEDEFARTLIPELFKHNNYASFVRQLNMYGFHKKVGLSDNSMKASETKAKAPSEYFNKYFKRGRPELLWLIQKPKNPSTANPKRKREDDNTKQGDSDDDSRRYVADTGGGSNFYDDKLAVRNQDMALIPRSEYNSLRSEVRQLQQQQKVISNVLSRIRQQNEQLYQQATAFQALHDRHENSINAILTFLATFYNRSLEGNNTVPNLADMFGAAMPQQQQTHGNVVDVGDFPENNISKSPQLNRSGRRPLALLPAPAPRDAAATTDRAATISPSVGSTATPTPKPTARQAGFNPPTQATRNGMQASSNLGKSSLPGQGSSNMSIKADPSETPPSLSQVPENDEVMSAIQNANASNSQTTNQGPQFDFPSALTHYQTSDGNVPLTPQQRNDVLSLMANNTSAASPNSTVTRTDNALVNPEPPAVPSLEPFEASQAQLDMLQKMSSEQGERVQNLQERLTPLSPSGTIPGLTDNSYFPGNLGEPGAYDLDLDSFVQGDDYFPTNPDGDTNLNLPDLNYELPDAEPLSSGGPFDGPIIPSGNDFSGSGLAPDGGGKVESVSSAAPSPTNTAEEVGGDDQARSPKRRRK